VYLTTFLTHELTVHEVVANAGIGAWFDIAGASVGAWKEVVGTNYDGVFYLARAAGPFVFRSIAIG
jgi:NAD(P)-dependent dehydrogenase (short-subunit alcohol dehydrogenase family)